MCDTINPAPKTLDRLYQLVEIEKAKRSASDRKTTVITRPPAADMNLFRYVNEVALKNLDVWVPTLLPMAKKTSEGYRVSSYDLGRDLEEDLSITEPGIKDFGVADMGDSQEGRRTPIDLVIEYADEIGLELLSETKGTITNYTKLNGLNALKATTWLSHELGIDMILASRHQTDANTALHAMNTKYAVVIDGGKTQVIYSDRQDIGGSNREVMKFWSFDDLKRFYQNRFVCVETFSEARSRRSETTETETVNTPLGKFWLDHPDRRQYSGLVFAPGKGSEIEGKLNLWRGFPIKPIRGDWSRMRRHIEEVLAAGNKEHAEYIIKWCAWAVQNPATRAQVALVLKGGKGTGKGVFGTVMVNLFGHHGIHISNVQQLVGNFNGHLRDACFVFCDEAFWGGDKANDGQLKRLITEPTLTIEKKHKDAEACTNMLHVMMASNESYVVPATENERRYAMFNVSDSKSQDPTWFDPIYKELESGGREAMLYDLLNMDLTGFHPRQVPLTDALLEQQEEGLSPIDSWWREILENGCIPGSTKDEPDFSYSHVLLESAQDSSTKLKEYLKAKKFGTYLAQLGCVPERKSNNLRGWKFPSLSVMRNRWEKRFPGTTWEDEELKEWFSDFPNLDGQASTFRDALKNGKVQP